MSVAASKNDIFLDFVAARLNDPGIDRIFTKIGSENRRQGDSRPCLSKKKNGRPSSIRQYCQGPCETPRKQRRPVGEKPDVRSDSQDRRPRSDACSEFLIRKYAEDESCGKGSQDILSGSPAPWANTQPDRQTVRCTQKGISFS